MPEAVVAATAITPVTPAEAVQLERDELARFINALEALPPDAWARSVRQSGWTVRDLVAHVSGTYAAQARFSELRHQVAPRVIRFYRMEGEPLAETVARIQIGDRRARTPDQLIVELREVGPSALDHREWLFRPLDRLSQVLGGRRFAPAVPLGPFHAVRDLWLHRYDVADATGTEFHLDDEHDRRIIELLLCCVAKAGDTALGDRAVDLSISGPAGGRWRFGEGEEPEAVIVMAPGTFARLLRKHNSPAGIRERSDVKGDVKAAMSLLAAIHSGG